MIVNYEKKTIQVKLVYYGPAMSGKTTMLKRLFKEFGKEGELTSIDTTTGRTLFFDFGSLNFKGSNWNIKILMYSATGQDFYASTRPSTLQGADGIIFVVDSQKELIKHAIQSWNELKNFFNSGFYEIPLVVCLNKQDLVDTIDLREIKEHIEFNLFRKFDILKTTAINGVGVKQSFQSMLNFVFPGISVTV